jgi:uncharacterized membrane protein
MPAQTSPTLSTAGRRLAAVSVILALMALFAALFLRASGEGGNWTAVAIPLLLVLNAIVMSFGAKEKHPRATRVYWLTSCAFALFVIFSLLSRLGR